MGEWATMPPAKRARILWNMADELEARAEHIAALETLDNGKPISNPGIDVRSTIDVFRYFAGWADKITGQTIPTTGPVSCTPSASRWGRRRNCPLEFSDQLGVMEVAPALACGNTVVLKPAEQTPLTALERPASARRPDFLQGYSTSSLVTDFSRCGTGESSRREQNRLHRLDDCRHRDRSQRRLHHETCITGIGR